MWSRVTCSNKRDQKKLPVKENRKTFKTKRKSKCRVQRMKLGHLEPSNIVKQGAMSQAIASSSAVGHNFKLENA